MRKIFIVARREYLETVKTKMFLFSVFFTPVLIIAIIFFSQSAARKRSSVVSRAPFKIVVVDLSKKIKPALEEVLSSYNKEGYSPQKIVLQDYSGDPSDMEQLTRKCKTDINNGQFDALLVISRDTLENGKSLYYMNAQNISSLETFDRIRGFVNRAAVQARAQLHHLSPVLLAQIQRPVQIEQVDVKTEQRDQPHFVVSLMAPFFFLFLMFFGLVSMNQHMLTSIIEEKSSRIMETLLATLSPFELMAGKILGLFSVGLTLIAVWVSAATLAAVYYGVGGLLNTAPLGLFIAYFILGFFLFSSVFAAIGSACNTLKEAQSLSTPIMLLLVIPMIAWFNIAQNPNGSLALILSFIPPVTPMIMILRVAADPNLPKMQIVASIGLLAICVPLTMWIAAKIFRTGVLMYGKPASLREIFRWLKYK